MMRVPLFWSNHQMWLCKQHFDDDDDYDVDNDDEKAATAEIYYTRKQPHEKFIVLW